MAESKDVQSVAIDDGYADIKTATGDIGQLRTGTFSTNLARGFRVHTALGAETTEDCTGYYVLDDDQRYTAGNWITGEETRFDGFHFSPLNRVAVHHGLHMSGVDPNRPVRLVCGLPVRAFFHDDGELRKDDIERKRSNLKKAVQRVSGDNAATIQVTDVEVVPQALAAWMDYAYDDQCRERDGNESDSAIGVVDVGGRTTDIAVVIGGSRLDQARSGTENIGALELMRALSTNLQKRFQFDEPVSRRVCDRVLASGRMKVFGKSEDVSDIINQARAEISAEIGRAVERFLGAGADLDAVLFVGGGVAALPEMTKAVRHKPVEIPEPALSNVRGMWKYQKLVDLAEAA